MEIQRKKEHQSIGSNFEYARAFVRRSFKTKNFNPENNPLLDLSSTDEEDYGDESGINDLSSIASQKKPQNTLQK